MRYSFHCIPSALLCCGWLLFSASLLTAQRNIPVQLLGPEKGLSQRSVLTIHQDSLGFIWVGTRDGLNEYDGNRVKIYRHVLGDTCSIAGNHINDIENGEGGNLWIAHDNGVSLFDRKKGVFRNYRMGGSPDHEIRSLSVIDGRVWASGWSGIYLYDKSSDLFTKPRNLTEDARVLDTSVSKSWHRPEKTSIGLRRLPAPFSATIFRATGQCVIPPSPERLCC